MANMRLPTATRNALANAVRDLIDAGAGPGTISIYSGAQPASANDAITGALLATLTFGDPSAGAAANGTSTANAITQDVSADATGIATHARIRDSVGNTVFDCDVTATGGGGTIELNTVNIVVGGPVQITAFSWTAPAG